MSDATGVDAPVAELSEGAPELTVVIVSYRCRDLLDRCLTSLSTSGAVAKVVVVDNDSGDGTDEMVQRAHQSVDFRQSGDNLGFARANNPVLREASTDFVLLLNPDTVVEPGALRACVDQIRAHPEVAVLGCKLVLPDGTLDHACKRTLPTLTNAIAYFLRAERLLARFNGGNTYRSSRLGDDETGPVDAINGAFMLVRRSAMEQVGVLDERFWMYGEDLDWCLRFRQAGWQVLYWPGATVVHLKGGSDPVARSWRSNRAFHQAMWLYYEKHHSHPRFPPVDWLVRAGIGAKLAVSASLSWWRRRK